MSHLSILAPTHAAPTSFLRQAIRVLAEWRERARTRRAMRAMCETRELDDHMLKDIGLSRSQLLFEATKPFRER
jgi:uncharacterized protein YjiS (DUF1127 family)